MRKKQIKLLTFEELVEQYPNETGVFYKQKIQEQKDEIEVNCSKEYEIKKELAIKIKSKPLYYHYRPSAYYNIRKSTNDYVYKIYEAHLYEVDKKVFINFDEIILGYSNDTKEFLTSLEYSEDIGCELFELIDLNSDEFTEIDEVKYKGIVKTFLNKPL